VLYNDVVAQDLIGIHHKKQRRPTTLTEEGKRAHLRQREITEKGHRTRKQMKEDKGTEGRSIGQRDRTHRRRKGISWAVPSKGSTWDKLRQRRTRNSKKTHYRGLGDSLTNAS
jgi:hypothetical protein